jgi:hypothetical protein
MARGIAASLAALAALAACSFGSPAAVDGMPGPPAEAGAPAFDPATDCPGTYTILLASTALTSRYRVITTTAQFWPHNTACNNDRPGVTHAAVLGAMTELLELEAHVDALPLDRFYLGGVQDPQATAPSQGWLWFDGTPLLQTAWYTQGSEPNDDGGIENQEQQLLILDTSQMYLQDAVGATAYGIICECDGTPVAATAQDFVDRDPNNPN